MSTTTILPGLLEIIHVLGVADRHARDAAAAAAAAATTTDGLMTSGASRRCESDFRDNKATTAAGAARCRRCCTSVRTTHVPVRRQSSPALCEMESQL